MVDEILEPFYEVLKTINLRKPEIPFISNVTGNWITNEEATQPEYWKRHMREMVRFHDGIVKLSADPHSVFIEVGTE